MSRYEKKDALMPYHLREGSIARVWDMIIRTPINEKGRRIITLTPPEDMSATNLRFNLYRYRDSVNKAGANNPAVRGMYEVYELFQFSLSIQDNKIIASDSASKYDEIIGEDFAGNTTTLEHREQSPFVDYYTRQENERKGREEMEQAAIARHAANDPTTDDETF